VGNSSNFSHTNAQIIKSAITTDKATALLDKNKYSFWVNRSCDKTTIKSAIESLLNVKVLKVNTCNIPKKKQIFKKQITWAPQYKKAIVTLSEGDKIILFPEN
jgi:large subunit ribosomal protein L23